VIQRQLSGNVTLTPLTKRRMRKSTMNCMRTAGLVALLGITTASVWAEPLKVVLSAERAKYTISDHLTIQVALVNVSDDQIAV
jgi:hypothetical protein